MRSGVVVTAPLAMKEDLVLGLSGELISVPFWEDLFGVGNDVLARVFRRGLGEALNVIAAARFLIDSGC